MKVVAVDRKGVSVWSRASQWFRRNRERRLVWIGLAVIGVVVSGLILALAVYVLDAAFGVIIPDDIWRSIEITGVLGAVVAIGFALWQFFDAREQTNTLKSVSESLSTQYLGTFPAHLPKIADLVNDASRTLTIFCDFPAYGAFSAPNTHRKYQQAIADGLYEKSDLKIEFICLTPNKRHEMLDQQFAPPEWEGWKKDPENKNRLERFCSYWPPPNGKSVETMSQEDFKECFESCNVDALEDRERFKHPRVTLEPRDIHMSVYFWIRDNTAAGFSIPSFAGTEKPGFHTADSNSFYTTDSNLIQALNSIFKRYKDAKHPDSDEDSESYR